MKYRSLIALLLSAASIVAVAQDRPSDADSQPGRGPKPPSFNELDTNSDGQLTLEEFSAQGNPPRGSISDIFNDIDSDGDGVITEQEMKNHRPPRPPKD